MFEPFCLQERYAPHNACFGCGPANEKGLRIRSMPSADTADAAVTASWSPEKHHEAFEGMVNGGIIGALLDCHSNWTAAWHLMKREGQEQPPCTVTADFHVKLRRPTPSSATLHLNAEVRESDGPKVIIDATLTDGENVCATCVGTFVAVKPGHPAYHRW